MRLLLNIDAYDSFCKRLIAKIDITDASSTFAIEQIKHTTALPFNFVTGAADLAFLPGVGFRCVDRRNTVRGMPRYGLAWGSGLLMTRSGTSDISGYL